MAYFFDELSRTFSEYLLVPGYSSSECVPSNVSLRTPLVKFRKGEESAISLNIPMVSAIMQSVSGERMGDENGVGAVRRQGADRLITDVDPFERPSAIERQRLGKLKILRFDDELQSCLSPGFTRTKMI